MYRDTVQRLSGSDNAALNTRLDETVPEAYDNPTFWPLAPAASVLSVVPVTVPERPLPVLSTYVVEEYVSISYQA